MLHLHQLFHSERLYKSPFLFGKHKYSGSWFEDEGIYSYQHPGNYCSAYTVTNVFFRHIWVKGGTVKLKGSIIKKII